MKHHTYSVGECLVSLTENREIVSGCKVKTGHGTCQWLILRSRTTRHCVSVIAAYGCLSIEILTWFAPLRDWCFIDSQQNSLLCDFPTKSCNNSCPCNHLLEISDIEFRGLTFSSKSVKENLDSALQYPKKSCFFSHFSYCYFSKRLSWELRLELNRRVWKSVITHIVTLVYLNLFQVADIYCLLLHTWICIRGKDTKIIKQAAGQTVKVIHHSWC